MSMKLYYSPGACSLAPHMILEEIGVPFTPVLVSLKDRAHHQPDYLQINPRARVPALQLGDFVLTENAAILTWLARRHPEKNLMPPAGTPAEARVLEWLAWLSDTVHIAFAQHWRPERFAEQPEGLKEVERFGAVVIERLFDEIEAKIPAEGYLVGPDLSVADASLAVFYRWGWRLDKSLPMAERYPRWTALTQRLAQRPAVQRALTRERTTLLPI